MYFLFVFLLTTIFPSCQKEEVEIFDDTAVIEFNLKAIDGGLSFDSHDSFQGFMESFENDDNGVIENIRKQDFISLQDFSETNFDNACVDESVSDLLIDDPYLRHVVNTDLEVQNGNPRCRYICLFIGKLCFKKRISTGGLTCLAKP